MKLKELFDIINHNNCCTNDLFNKILRIIENPQFDYTWKCHCWKTYISIEVENGWNKLSMPLKLVLYLHAQRQANGEEWD